MSCSIFYCTFIVLLKYNFPLQILFILSLNLLSQPPSNSKISTNYISTYEKMPTFYQLSAPVVMSFFIAISRRKLSNPLPKVYIIIPAWGMRFVRNQPSLFDVICGRPRVSVHGTMAVPGSTNSPPVFNG